MFQLKILYYLLQGALKPKFQNRAQLLQFQQSQLQKHLSWVRANSPFYKKKQNVDFEQLPIMNKAEMMANFDELNTAKVLKSDALRIATDAETTRNFDMTLGDVTVGLSSGTSGNKGIFLATENERAQWVAEVLRRVLPIKLGKKQRIAFFLRSNSKLYESVKSKAFEFHFFDLAKSIETLINELAILQPNVVIAPPSALLEIAQKIENKAITIAPYKVVSVAEVLEKDIQHYLENVFQQTIHQVYQATEGFLGSTCPHGTLHLHEDLILFEKKYIDQDKTAFYPILSDFTRKTQPMLRYELNDILHERSEPCHCGSVFTAIDHIEGRSDDILIFDGVKIFPDFFRYAVLLSSDDILNFQIIQVANNQLLVKLKIKKNCDFNAISKTVEKKILTLLSERNIQHCSISLAPLMHDDFYNKFRRVQKAKF
jgi:putative adenylate-forming enzyme